MTILLDELAKVVEVAVAVAKDITEKHMPFPVVNGQTIILIGYLFHGGKQEKWAYTDFSDE